MGAQTQTSRSLPHHESELDADDAVADADAAAADAAAADSDREREDDVCEVADAGNCGRVQST